jgi:hypothetical protein
MAKTADLIQGIAITIVEGPLAGTEVFGRGDNLAPVDYIIKQASYGTVGYTKTDIQVFFATGFVFHTGFDITEKSSVGSLLDQIINEARFYTGNCPSHMTAEQYNSFVPYMNTKKIAAFCRLSNLADEF